jgi:hypothetical protein
LENANGILSEKVFNIDDWNVIGEYVYDVEGGRHQAFYSPKRDVICMGVEIQAGERVQVEQSLKYSDTESRVLWDLTGLKEIEKWSASTEQYSKSELSLAQCGRFNNPGNFFSLGHTNLPSRKYVRSGTNASKWAAGLALHNLCGQRNMSGAT